MASAFLQILFVSQVQATKFECKIIIYNFLFAENKKSGEIRKFIIISNDRHFATYENLCICFIYCYLKTNLLKT